MKTSNALLRTMTVAAIGFGCFQVSAGTTGNAADNTSAMILIADNSSTTRAPGSEPAVGGEGDGAIGGNAPNLEPDRSMETVVDDAGITAAAKSKLLRDTEVGGLKIDVDTRDGVVYLTGDHMNSQAEIDQAVSLAKSVDGVTEVVSKLAVGDIKR